MKARQILKETYDLGQYQYVVSRALFLMTSKADKLPLETKPVARDNNTILTNVQNLVTKLCHALLNW